MNKRKVWYGIVSVMILAGCQVNAESPGKEESANGTPVLTGEDLKGIPLADEFVILDKHREAVVKQAEAQKALAIEPTRIEIEKINVSAEVSEVGILENGQMGVPEAMDEVGWFEPGAKPGEKGNAVLAGHVDSRTGPAIFFDLEKLEKGDEVKVTDSEGQTLTFVVTGKERYPYQDAPIGNIFGATEKRALNLITCIGTFNRDARTHEERLVITTDLKDPVVADRESSDVGYPSNVKVSGELVSWHAVRNDAIVGYRIYRKEDGGWKHIESVSAHERKSIHDANAEENSYAVTAIHVSGEESIRSAPSSLKK